MTPAARRDAVSALLRHPEWGAVWVVEIEGVVEGYVAVAYGFSIVFGGRDGLLDEICIAARWRGAGIGSAVLIAVMAELRADGVKALHLEVNREKPEAAALYERLGFAMRRHYHLMTAEF